MTDKLDENLVREAQCSKQVVGRISNFSFQTFQLAQPCLIVASCSFFDFWSSEEISPKVKMILSSSFAGTSYEIILHRTEYENISHPFLLVGCNTQWSALPAGGAGQVSATLPESTSSHTSCLQRANSHHVSRRILPGSGTSHSTSYSQGIPLAGLC